MVSTRYTFAPAGEFLWAVFQSFHPCNHILHRGPSLSPTVHRPVLRGASRWFLPRYRLPQQIGVGEDGDGADEQGLRADVHWG